MIKLLILIIITFIMFNFVVAQSLQVELEKVRKIKLLESNRDEVRRIFASYNASPPKELGKYDLFRFNNINIDVLYSDGRCKDKESEGFDIDKWVVEEITIKPNETIKLKNFKFNFSSFRKERRYIDQSDVFYIHDKVLGIKFLVYDDLISDITLLPSSKFYSKMCDKKKAQILTKSKSIFTETLKERISGCIITGISPDVDDIILGYSEIFKSCENSKTDKNSSCLDNTEIVAVFAVAKDLEGQPLTYSYKVSGGKIVGTGEKVLWDLSDVKAGSYTITVAVDDGCGFCGKTMTKTIVVKECSECKQ